MKIEVQLFATLAQYLPAGRDTDRAIVEMPPGARVADVLAALGVPAAMPRIVLVNGHDAADDHVLEPDDVVAAFPPLAGGR
ncbi:MAG: MoaD/ThiS family protein [Candidatus Rokubacteria bacterium]|nr:MoaD/ThiS family protein [Candidatus Rokubacteria bacterium]